MLTAKEALLKTQNAKKGFKEDSIKFFNSEKKHIEQLIIDAAKEGKTEINIRYTLSELAAYDLKNPESINILTKYIKKELLKRGYGCSISRNLFTEALLVTCNWGGN